MNSYGPGQRSAITEGLLLPLLFAGEGCGRSGIAQAIASFKESGHAVGAFADIAAGAFGATRCQTGTIDRLAVLLCEYPNTECAAMGKPAAEAWGASSPLHTVVVLHRKSTLLAIADRSHADPDGKLIAALSRTFHRSR